MQVNNIPKMSKNISFKILYNWFKDDAFRILFKNAGTLLSGNIIAWIIGLITFALTARILGPAQFGTFVLITTYITIIDKLINFQSWQALIHYGADALEREDAEDFKAIIKFTAIIDIFTAVLGTIVAILLSWQVGQWLGWESETVLMAKIYSLVILFNISGSPTGLIRLFNRFGLFAVQQIVTALLKLIGIVFIFFIGGSFWFVLILWIMTTIVGQLLLLGLGWRELFMQGYHDVLKVPLYGVSKRHSGIWAFILSTNLNGSIRMASRELDTMIIGGIVGAEGAGLYKIAKQIAAIPAMISDPLYQAIYPDLSKLWARGDITKFKQLILRSGLVAGGGASIMWLGFILFGSFFIQIVFGEEYFAALPILILYMLAMVIAIYGFPLQPAMLAMGRPKTTFWVHLLSTIFYFPLLFIFLEHVGLIGAGIAYVCYYLLWTCLMISLEYKILKEKNTLPNQLSESI